MIMAMEETCSVRSGKVINELQISIRQFQTHWFSIFRTKVESLESTLWFREINYQLDNM